MNKILVTTLFLLSSFCYANLTPYLKTDIGDSAKNNSIKNIDAIYLINLDQRPEKREKVLSQLTPYGITPYRFSAVYGWGLPVETLIQVGTKYDKKMTQGKWVLQYSTESGNTPKEVLLQEDFHGERCFAKSMTLGGIGCALSHLSVLQNAYDQGYETIWMMEDDILVEDNPHLLGDYIAKLDALVGRGEWDILYTGFDAKNRWSYSADNDFLSDLKGCCVLWRPDIDFSDQKKYAKRTVLNEDFIEIGSRLQATSLIVRRSGMKKILDFLNTHHLFLPYDMELPVIPNLKFINPRATIISDETCISDTQANWLAPTSAWDNYQSEVLKSLSNMSQQANLKAAQTLMSFIQRKKPAICVEIGCYGGAFTYPIGMALQYQKKGELYAIDNWSQEASTKDVKNPWDIEHLNKIDYSGVYRSFTNLLEGTHLDACCHPMNKAPEKAASTFADQSIDLLVLHRIQTESESLEAVSLFLPKVKDHGDIWVLQPMDPSKGKVIGYLMEHCNWIKEESNMESCVLFKKEKESSTIPNKKRKWFSL